MQFRFVFLFAALLVFFAAGCSEQSPLPLRDIHPTPSTFSLEVKTSEMIDALGSLEERDVNANVVPARAAIEFLEQRGYKYDPEGGRWRIRVDLICYDPSIVRRVHMEHEMAEIAAPVYYGDLLGPVGEDWMTASIDQGWIEVTHSAKGMVCGAKARLTVTDLEEVTDNNTFVGEGFAGQCPYNNGCAYQQCQDRLQLALPKLLGKVFK